MLYVRGQGTSSTHAIKIQSLEDSPTGNLQTNYNYLQVYTNSFVSDGPLRPSHQRAACIIHVVLALTHLPQSPPMQTHGMYLLPYRDQVSFSHQQLNYKTLSHNLQIHGSETSNQYHSNNLRM